jgi:hypothetical protein
MNTPNSQIITLTININPASSGDEIIEQATHAFFTILQNASDPQNHFDLGGFSAVYHQDRFDLIKWNAMQIATDYQTDAKDLDWCGTWVVTHDIFLAYPNARPTLIKAGTEVVKQDDGTFITSCTISKPHVIPAEAVTRKE